MTLLVVGRDGNELILGADGKRAHGCKMTRTEHFVFAAAGYTEAVGGDYNAHEIAREACRHGQTLTEQVEWFEGEVFRRLPSALVAMRSENQAVFQKPANRRLTVVFGGIEGGKVRAYVRKYQGDEHALRIDRLRADDYVSPFAKGVLPLGDGGDAVQGQSPRRPPRNLLDAVTSLLHLGGELKPDSVGPPFQIARITTENGIEWLPPDPSGG